MNYYLKCKDCGYKFIYVGPMVLVGIRITCPNCGKTNVEYNRNMQTTNLKGDPKI